MKKLYYLFFLAVIASFVACGSDDDDAGGVAGASIVGTWNIVYGVEQRYENNELVREREGALEAPYDQIIFTANTFAYMEYSNSKGTWHEDGTGTWRQGGTRFVFTSNDFQYVEVTDYDGKDALSLIMQSSEDKVSVIVTKKYRFKLQRVR